MSQCAECPGAGGPDCRCYVAKALDYDVAALPLRHSPGGLRGGRRGKRHDESAKRRTNRLTISRRVRRKHRRQGG